MELDFDRLRVKVAGRPVKLSGLQLRMLMFLGRRPGIVFTREELLENVWGADAGGHDLKVVDVLVCRLRARLRAAGAQTVVLESVRSTGYRLRCPGNSAEEP
jgi:DNA-binding response OmpR family regulator